MTNASTFWTAPDEASPPEPSARTTRLAALRQLLAQAEHATRSAGPGPGPGRESAVLPLDLPALRDHLPGHGLARGCLHEMTAASTADTAAAFGFVAALTGAALAARPGPAVLVVARRGLAGHGIPYGHGLRRLGVDVSRLIVVDVRNETDALQALEESLRAEAGLAAVAGVLGRSPDLTASRRLSLAAAASGAPLLLLRPAQVAGASAAATRWRIAALPAGRDAHGTFARWRWAVTLERCRNGRPGHWTFEWDHAAHRLRAAAVLADRALPARPGQAAVRRAR
ncbi:MAG: ImuA protein [Alphaproteobacteria bacterium]|nr:ImuA protein [Alphaproteobacteria bacterium]